MAVENKKRVPKGRKAAKDEPPKAEEKPPKAAEEAEPKPRAAEAKAKHKAKLKAKKAAEAEDGSKKELKEQRRKERKEAEEAAAAEAEDQAEELAVEEGTETRKTKANRLNEEAKEPEVPRGVIFLGHIPRGFAEPQMMRFFKQFGFVTRLRLSRSKKNAKPKGCAFIEFEDEEVAKIVANTMNNYLLFGRKLNCHFMERAKVHPALFKDWKRRMRNFEKTRQRQYAATFNERPKVEVDGELVPQWTERQVKKVAFRKDKLGSKLAALGVEYDLDEVYGPGEAGAKAGAKAKADGSEAASDSEAEPLDLEQCAKAGTKAAAPAKEAIAKRAAAKRAAASAAEAEAEAEAPAAQSRKGKRKAAAGGAGAGGEDAGPATAPDAAASAGDSGGAAAGKRPKKLRKSAA